MKETKLGITNELKENVSEQAREQKIAKRQLYGLWYERPTHLWFAPHATCVILGSSRSFIFFAITTAPETVRCGGEKWRIVGVAQFSCVPCPFCPSPPEPQE